MKSTKNEVKDIKKKMMQSLELVDGKGYLQGEYLCHEDIPEETPIGFDAHFCVMSDREDVCYLVLIQKIEM